jgi:hypothetical protein
VGSLLHWEEGDTLSLTILNNIVDNSVISHIQSCNLAHGAWVKLNKILGSKDVVIKMLLDIKLHTIKLKNNNSFIKHIHIFRTLLEQLSTAGSPIANDEAILSLMKNMPKRYKTFISSMR